MDQGRHWGCLVPGGDGYVGLRRWWWWGSVCSGMGDSGGGVDGGDIGTSGGDGMIDSNIANGGCLGTSGNWSHACGGMVDSGGADVAMQALVVVGPYMQCSGRQC